MAELALGGYGPTSKCQKVWNKLRIQTFLAQEPVGNLTEYC
jgi:hypothetical protein